MFRDLEDLRAEKEGLEIEINNIRPQLDKLLDMINGYKKLKEDVKKNKNKINKGENYEFK